MFHARIATRAFNTPLLVEPFKAMAFLSGLGPRERVANLRKQRSYAARPVVRAADTRDPLPSDWAGTTILFGRLFMPLRIWKRIIKTALLYSHLDHILCKIFHLYTLLTGFVAAHSHCNQRGRAAVCESAQIEFSQRKQERSADQYHRTRSCIRLQTVVY